MLIAHCKHIFFKFEMQEWSNWTTGMNCILVSLTDTVSLIKFFTRYSSIHIKSCILSVGALVLEAAESLIITRRFRMFRKFQVILIRVSVKLTNQSTSANWSSQNPEALNYFQFTRKKHLFKREHRKWDTLIMHILSMFACGSRCPLVPG